MTSTNRFKFSEPQKNNHFLYKDKSQSYKYKEDDFPDIASVTKKTENVTRVEPKKYLSAAVDINKTIDENKEDAVPPGCIKYEKHKNKRGLQVTYGDKLQKQTNRKIKYIDLGPLVDNWNHYKLKYDEIHGEGAYAEAYFLEPIYKLDEDFSDTESDNDQKVYDSYEEYETF